MTEEQTRQLAVDQRRYMGQLGNIGQGIGGAGGSIHNHFAQALMGAQEQKKMYAGNKPLVICGGTVTEAKDLDDAQRIAESEAHKQGADAYILKPIKRIAPKRDVVTTELT